MIKIDMEMPETCEKCLFFIDGVSNRICFALNGLHKVEVSDERPDNCPLIEVVE